MGARALIPPDPLPPLGAWGPVRLGVHSTECDTRRPWPPTPRGAADGPRGGRLGGAAPRTRSPPRVQLRQRYSSSALRADDETRSTLTLTRSSLAPPARTLVD